MTHSFVAAIRGELGYVRDGDECQVPCAQRVEEDATGDWISERVMGAIGGIVSERVEDA
jgi:hypothetical protein